MAARSSAKRLRRLPPVLGSLNPTECGEVLAGLLVAHPELRDEAEQMANGLLSSTSSEEVASAVERALLRVPLDDLAARAGRVPGGYVHETDAAWELVEETMEPFRADLQRRAALGLTDAATDLAVGIISGLYRVREPEMGTVLAYSGEDTPEELADGIVSLADELGIAISDDIAESHWSDWVELG